MNLCFFTDETAANFKPITLTRPLDDVRIGIFTIREKWLNHLNTTTWVRSVDNYLSSLFPSNPIKSRDDYFWINSRFLPNQELVYSIKNLKPFHTLYWKNQLIAARISADITYGHLDRNEIPTTKNSSQLTHKPDFITYFWDILAFNADQIRTDINVLPLSFDHLSTAPDHVIIQHPTNTIIHSSAIIEPGCIIIADDGPVYLGAHCKLEAGTIIKGPVAICDHSEIKMGARIYNGSSIGPVCKVGGEISNSIFHSYSNKSHDGFMGSSIIGQWNNFGAGTNTSNLKNNYSPVKLVDWEKKTYYEGGVQFFGSVFGDFSKTAIQTKLNTGTICGVSSNILASGFPPKLIPSFKWLSDTPETYNFEKAIETMRAIMGRRNISLSEEYSSMMRYIYNLENTPSS